MDKRPRITGALRPYVFWGLLLLGFFLTSRYSYPLFRSIAGFFSAVIATGVFAIAWNSRRFQANNYLLFLGIAYLFVGALDLLYTLAYQDIGLFPGFGKLSPPHLWFAARTLEGISLFLAPQFIDRRLRPYVVLTGYFLTFIVIILIIFFWHLIASNFIWSGPGLTALKKTAEYINTAILWGAMALLWRQREEFDPDVLRLLLGALTLALGSEIALTFMAGVSAAAGLVGHLLKIASFYLIYRAFIATELIKPYNRLFQNLRLNGEVLRKEKDFTDRLIEMAQVIVLVLNGEGRIIRLNHMCEAITGYSLAEVKNRFFWEVFPAPEEVDEVQEAFFNLISGDFSQSWQLDWVAKNGTRRLIDWSNTAFPKEDGSVEYVIGTGIDITERREIVKHLHRLNGKLEQQIQDKPEVAPQIPDIGLNQSSTFDADFDDLRAPVRWLRGYCRALQGHSATRLNSRGQEYIRNINKIIRQMEEHIAAKLEHDHLSQAKIQPDIIDLSLQARLISVDLKRTAPTRQVTFIIEPGLTAAGDPAMIRTLLKNLIGNAWKSTHEVLQGRIEFGALPSENCSNGFFVRDNRTDFGSHYGKKLFRSFQRLQSCRDFSGSDINLDTARSIILRHGGRIWAEGTVGQGVTFYFTLPNPPPKTGWKSDKRDASGCQNS